MQIATELALPPVGGELAPRGSASRYVLQPSPPPGAPFSGARRPLADHPPRAGAMAPPAGPARRPGDARAVPP